MRSRAALSLKKNEKRRDVEMQAAIQATPQRTLSVADRIKKLQSRPLAVTKTGDPEAKKSYSVHTCYARGFKPSWCKCSERVSSSVAHKLIEEGKAEWVKSLKKDGSIYTWRKAVVLTGAANPGIASQCSDVVHIVSERIEIQKAYAAELEAKALERNRKKRQRSIRALILKFREHLSPEENDRCFDDQEILVNLEKDDAETYLFIESVAGPRDVNPKPHHKDDHILEWLGKVSRIGSALKEAQIRYWNIRLSEEGLTLEAGRHFKDAPKGHGLIVTGGYNGELCEKVYAHREANEDGIHQATAANEHFGEHSDDYEANQVQFHAPTSKELEIKTYELLPERSRIAPDVFEMEEKRIKEESRLERLAKKQGITPEEASQEDALHNL